MFGFGKKKPKAEKTEAVEAHKIEGIVSANQLLADSLARGMRERRKNIRVRYPAAGAIGDLPTVEIKGLNVVPLNLSQGGMLLPLTVKDLVVGQVYPVKIIWKYGPLIFNHEAEFIRQSGDHFHFKFTKVDIRSFTEFSKSFNAGIKGAQTRLSKGDKAAAYLLEFWQHPDGDKILFQKISKGEVADIFTNGFRVTFTPDKGMLREEQDSQGQWGLHPARLDVIEELLIFLTNIPEPTERILKLISQIVEKHFSVAA